MRWVAAERGAARGAFHSSWAGSGPGARGVLAVRGPFWGGGIGNPSARHSLGAEARESLDAARVKVARLCGGAAGGIVFTSGATEANNLAIKGVVARPRSGGAARVLLSAIEHSSGINPCRHPAKGGATVCH